MPKLFTGIFCGLLCSVFLLQAMLFFRRFFRSVQIDIEAEDKELTENIAEEWT